MRCPECGGTNFWQVGINIGIFGTDGDVYECQCGHRWEEETPDTDAEGFDLDGEYDTYQDEPYAE